MNEQQPLVSCIMPTYNRRKFVPHAIRYFLRQEYNNKELIIIDDGTDPIIDLVPDKPNIRYFRLDQKLTLGAKLNMACTYANGEIIANWDDDDWYAERRLNYQVAELTKQGTDVCGLNKLLYYDLGQKNGYQYSYPSDEKAWLLGSSLCYKKEFWSGNKYADINIGMDALFVWGTSADRITALPDHTIAVHTIHDQNVSPKKMDNAWWERYPEEELEKVMSNDWDWYQKAGTYELINKQMAVNGTVPDQPYTASNIYLCLVHENGDCIIDLIRNLHYQDPESMIILYNGSNNPDLLKIRFPFENFGVVCHPKPVPVKYGYLHNCALSCMQFALDNFSFEYLTIVDSDQLAIRSGYTRYLRRYMESQSNAGMLSNRPERFTAANQEVWTSIQAFKEYELWKPFLKNFHDGESKFVHWTFWPSTVFTAEAASDLVKIFHTNKQLQGIMQQTEIWATEEIILPTLVSLLGYDIIKNPCCHDFVQYQQSYTPQDIDRAIEIPQAYWIHPVTRKYDDPVRKHTRYKLRHYSADNNNQLDSGNKPEPFLSIPLINKSKEVEGWIDELEADLLISTTLKACIDFPGINTVVEVGSYHGRSTIIIASVLKAFFPGAKIYSIDPHDGKLGALDQGLYSFPPSYDHFLRNIQRAQLADVVGIIRSDSSSVKWDKAISFLYIDGLHDYPNVSRDYYRFSEWIVTGGFIAFHDYADYFPGVKAFVRELLDLNAYREVFKVSSLIVLQKLPGVKNI
ncbi:glycosyltransferase [Flavihumibacter sp. R14]|nr:glycosyltransferase [Flavihumibacter soli]